MKRVLVVITLVVLAGFAWLLTRLAHVDATPAPALREHGRSIALGALDDERAVIEPTAHPARAEASPISGPPDPRGDRAADSIATDSEPTGTPERARRIESAYQSFLESFSSDRGIDQYQSALALLTACLTAELEAQGRGVPVRDGERVSLKSRYSGEVRLVSAGTLFVFSESEFPEYQQVRREYWRLFERKAYLDDPPRPTDLLPVHLRSEIDALVASSIATAVAADR